MKFLGNNITTLADITSVTAGTGLSGGGTSGDVTLNVDASQPTITTLAGVNSLGVASATTNIAAGDLTMYGNVNDGNPTFSIGSSATNKFEMVSTYNSGAQTLDSVSFNSYTTSTTTNDGRYFWRVDEVQIMALLDAGLTVYGNILAGAGGAGKITAQNTTTSSATEGGRFILQCDDGAAMGDDHRLGVIEFSGAEDASNNRQTGARIQAMCDAAWSASENGTRLEFYTMDGNAASELSLTLDSDLLATFAGGVTVTGALSGTLATVSQPNITTLAGLTSLGAAGATTDIVAGDLTMYNAVNGGNPSFSIGSSGANRFVTTAVYNSGAQTLDSVNFQTFTTSGDTNDGRFIFSVDEVELLRILDTGITSSGIGSFKGGITATNETASSATEGGKLILQADDGAVMADNHRLGVIEFSGAEDASATRSIGARIQAICRDAWDGSNNDADLEFYTTDGTTESKVLTLDADKLATFAGGVTVTGTITGNVTGDLTGEADTVATIAGLAPNTATTQATQAAITTCANLVTVGTIGTGVWNATAIASAKMATGTASAQGALELATTGEADTGTDTARAVTPAGLKSHVDANARKCILRHHAFYVNDNPMVQNNLYFGGNLGHQPSNWNDPAPLTSQTDAASAGVSGIIGDPDGYTFTIAKGDENWGMVLPFDISKVEVQCSLQPQLGTGDDFTVAIYTGIRPNDSAAVLTLTKVAHQSIAFSSGSNRTMINDVSLTADLAKNTMIYVGLGSEDNTNAKNGRGYLTVTVTER